jgi:hypothetical protein
MGRPRIPDLTPITRYPADLIPTAELVEQVMHMDRLGTWCLQQYLATFEGIENGLLEDNRYHTARMARLSQASGALLGSINSRVSTFKFMQEVANGEHPGGRAERYNRPGRPRLLDGPNRLR